MIKYVDIESEIFDFKKEASDLHEDICAMANTQEGIIVLGVSQVDSEDHTKILRFEKTGFELGKEDGMKNTIGNYVAKIEPLPVFDVKPIYDKNMNKFFMVIKIESKLSDRPYFLKTTDQCFVRIHNSSRRVGRTAILNLFSASIERINNIEKLNVASKLVREAVFDRISTINSKPFHDDAETISPIDLTFLKDGILHSEWFLKEKNLLGGSKDAQTFAFGIFTVLNTIERLNAWLGSYNVGFIRGNVRNQILNWSHGSSGSVIGLLDQIIKACEEFLSKYHNTS